MITDTKQRQYIFTNDVPINLPGPFTFVLNSSNGHDMTHSDKSR